MHYLNVKVSITTNELQSIPFTISSLELLGRPFSTESSAAESKTIYYKCQSGRVSLMRRERAGGRGSSGMRLQREAANQ